MTPSGSRVIVAAVSAAVIVGLTGCDIGPNARVYNGLGRSITLEVYKLEIREPQKAQLAPGGSVRIWNIGPELQLTYEGCTRRYPMPEMELNFPWRRPDTHMDTEHTYPVLLQLQSDGSLHLMPDGAQAIVSRAELSSAQAHGFPVTPFATTCP